MTRSRPIRSRSRKARREMGGFLSASASSRIVTTSPAAASRIQRFRPPRCPAEVGIGPADLPIRHLAPEEDRRADRKVMHPHRVDRIEFDRCHPPHPAIELSLLEPGMGEDRLGGCREGGGELLQRRWREAIGGRHQADQLGFRRSEGSAQELAVTGAGAATTRRRGSDPRPPATPPSEPSATISSRSACDCARMLSTTTLGSSSRSRTSRIAIDGAFSATLT